VFDLSKIQWNSVSGLRPCTRPWRRVRSNKPFGARLEALQALRQMGVGRFSLPKTKGFGEHHELPQLGLGMHLAYKCDLRVGGQK